MKRLAPLFLAACLSACANIQVPRTYSAFYIDEAGRTFGAAASFGGAGKAIKPLRKAQPSKEIKPYEA